METAKTTKFTRNSKFNLKSYWITSAMWRGGSGTDFARKFLAFSRVFSRFLAESIQKPPLLCDGAVQGQNSLGKFVRKPPLLCDGVVQGRISRETFSRFLAFSRVFSRKVSKNHLCFVMGRFRDRIPWGNLSENHLCYVMGWFRDRIPWVNLWENHRCYVMGWFRGRFDDELPHILCPVQVQKPISCDTRVQKIIHCAVQVQKLNFANHRFNCQTLWFQGSEADFCD